MTKQMLRGWVLLAAALALWPAALAAQLWVPRSVQEAYAAGTRSPDGRPGPRYWQNHGRYAITVTATPPDRTVRGSERIVYHNESPDTLESLVFKLFLNIHRPGAPRAGGVEKDFLTSGVHVDSFAVGGRPAPWPEDPRAFTWQAVRLPAPLAPRDSVRLDLAWHYEISKEAGREGMLDSTTYYLAYFYPRVAVYDDVDGWDTMDFDGRQEFYSDFNDYDVTLRVPAGFVVWGTGTLTNPEAVLQPTALERYRHSLTSDSVIRVATPADYAAGRVTRAGGINEWRFRARNVPDVAFALSDHYDWDAASVVVDDATGRRASVQAAYNDTASDFHSMVEFGRHALDWFSHRWPGVPYPYEKSTIVHGSADMEYPMMVNDGSNADTTFSRFVAEHEIAHTYFPFYMGIDETRWAFMDEGWATALEYLINRANMGPGKAADFFREFRVDLWIHDPSALEDLPIITPADVLSGRAYSSNAYGKPALGYLALKDMLGDETFRRALHAYIERWHGKHPIPWDFFHTFGDVTGKDLDWFWRDWYFSNGYIDLAVRGADRVPGGYSVRVENVGGLDAPFDLVLHWADGTRETLHRSAAVWQADGTRASVPVRTTKTLAAVGLDHGIWMDADESNDGWAAR
jgi:hypothetical protein